MAAVCLDCFESMRNQFTEGAKYGIPVEKRQYNWLAVPPPPDDGGVGHLTTPRERLDKIEKHAVSHQKQIQQTNL